MDKEILEALKKPSKPCSCGNWQIAIGADEDTKLWYAVCPECKKEGFRGKTIQEAIKLWNKQTR